MNVTLFKFNDHPDRIAINKAGEFVESEAFFLDFSRPLEVHRRFLIPVGLLVPVVHVGERAGCYVISILRSDPYFVDIRLLWKERYPLPASLPDVEVDEFQLVADFARQFPNDC